MSQITKLPRLLIVGNGWGGTMLLQNLNLHKFAVTLVSSSQTLSYTPLLASAACGLFDFRVTEETVRTKNRHFNFYRAIVTDVDFKRKRALCKPVFEDLQEEEFEVPYDLLILSHGTKGQTFGIPGVKEHALQLRATEDAQKLRGRIVDAFEKASLPIMDEERQKQVLHFGIVGGGPTGIEVAAELSDLFKELEGVYPHLKGLPTVSVWDVAPDILSMLEQDLADYAKSSFKERGVEVITGAEITEVKSDGLVVKGKGHIPLGTLIWATGNAAVPLTENLQCKKTSKGLPRLLTNDHLQLLDKRSRPLTSVFAIGDAADIDGEDKSLPTTAEVVCQKAKYLSGVLNDSVREDVSEHKPFAMHQKKQLVYLGGFDGVWRSGSRKHSGRLGWIAWRSATLTWTLNWRKKVAILVSWASDYMFGKEIARK